MDYLWSPWRYRYLAAPPVSSACIFCQKAAENKDRENLVVWRGRYNFALLNLYPYTSGHLMVVPYAHVATLEDTPADTAVELMLTVRQAEKHLRALYRPDGINLGMNIGQAAGAGIAGHIHMHILPRWFGDANFMTTVGETRVIPEELAVTYDRLSRAFAGEQGASHEIQPDR
jgi:ATP adenylyltransferase